MLAAKDYLAQTYPYWNRTGGRDHLFYFGHDEGACFVPHEIKRAVILTHWGRMHANEIPVSSSAFEGDNYDNRCALEGGGPSTPHSALSLSVLFRRITIMLFL